MILEVGVERMERAATARRAEIHALASLIAVATHNPKRFPSYAAFVGGAKARSGSSDMAIAAYFLTIKAQRDAHG